MNKVFLSVVIPSYNEMVNLQKGVLYKIEHFLGKQDYSWEVIVVDDGSDDGSVEFVEKFTKEDSRFKLIKNLHQGKAGAVTKGMIAAKGEYRLFTDMDQATPIEEVRKLLLHAKNFDVIIGSRSGKRKGAPWTRLVMANGMIILRKILVGLYGISDTQCGFKMFSSKAAEKLFSKITKLHNGFQKISGSSVTAGFDIELLLLASKMGLRIKEVPVEWLYVETRRVNPIKDSIEGLADLLTITLNKVSGKYVV